MTLGGEGRGEREGRRVEAGGGDHNTTRGDTSLALVLAQEQRATRKKKPTQDIKTSNLCVCRRGMWGGYPHFNWEQVGEQQSDTQEQETHTASTW